VKDCRLPRENILPSQIMKKIGEKSAATDPDTFFLLFQVIYTLKLFFIKILNNLKLKKYLISSLKEFDKK